MSFDRSFAYVELEFKLVYVGDAKEDKHDQVLDVVVIDAVAPGTYKFVFEVKNSSQRGIDLENYTGPFLIRHLPQIQKNYQMMLILMFRSFFFWLCIAIKNLHVLDIMSSPNTKILN